MEDSKLLARREAPKRKDSLLSHSSPKISFTSVKCCTASSVVETSIRVNHGAFFFYFFPGDRGSLLINDIILVGHVADPDDVGALVEGIARLDIPCPRLLFMIGVFTVFDGGNIIAHIIAAHYLADKRSAA